MTTRTATPHRLPSVALRRELLTFAVFAGLALLVYWPALGGPLIYDDFHHITRPELRTWQGLWRIWSDPWTTAQYYPVTHSFFWLQHRIWGDAVVWYHTVNVLLHGGAALLLSAVTRKLGFGRAAFWGALLFLLHPVAVESVAWISEQKNTLSGVFFLGAALAYLDFHDSRHARAYTLATSLFVLALLSKSVTATLPAALLVIFWWRTGSLQWRRDFLPLLPWLALGVLSGLHTAWLEKHSIGAQGPAFDLGAIERVLLAGRVFWFYLGKGFCPTELIFNYPRWSIEAGQFSNYIPLLGALALVGAAAWFGRKNRGPLAWLLLFGGMLFPVMGFFNVYPFRFSYVADHFMYLTLLPLTAGAALVIDRTISKTSPKAEKFAWGVVCVGLLILGVGAHRHSRIFSNEEFFYREILARNPQSALARYNLGTLLARQPGGTEKAIAEYRAAIAIDPTYAEAHNNLGMLLQKIPGRNEDARSAFKAALAAMPDLVEANYNLAMTLQAEASSAEEAIRLLEKSVHLRPKFAEGHFQLGRLYERNQQAARAENAYKQALQLRPDFAAAHFALGLLFSETPARFPEAESELAEAVRLDPGSAEIHYSLGAVRARLPGRQDAAIESYRTALRLAPDFAEAHNNLGRLLAQKPGGLPEAIEHFEAALRIDPASAAARRNLETARRSLMQSR